MHHHKSALLATGTLLLGAAMGRQERYRHHISGGYSYPYGGALALGLPGVHTIEHTMRHTDFPAPIRIQSPSVGRFNQSGLIPAILGSMRTFDLVRRDFTPYLTRSLYDYDFNLAKRTALRIPQAATPLQQASTTSDSYQSLVKQALVNIRSSQDLYTRLLDQINADLGQQVTNLQQDTMSIGTQLRTLLARTGGELLASPSTPLASPPVSTDRLANRPGMKQFNIDGQLIWALNEKNARRKATDTKTNDPT